MIELQRAAIENADARVERRHRTSEHMCAESQPAFSDRQLKMHSRARPERPRPLDEGAARTEIDQRDSIARTENRLHPGDDRLPEAGVESTFN
jgi:hypothetical protein